MGASEANGDVMLLRRSGRVVIVLHLAYAAATTAGFMTLPSAQDAIADPWFAIMEWLIIAIGPPVLLFLCGLAGIRGAGRAWCLAAVVLAATTFALSAALHAAILAIGRGDPLTAAGGTLGFAWPSVAYAIDVLAWDWFFALALLCCGMALRNVPRMHSAARAFVFAGVLALAGLAGPLTGVMILRNVGILGYAVVFPVAVWLVLRGLDGRSQAQKS